MPALHPALHLGRVCSRLRGVGGQKLIELLTAELDCLGRRPRCDPERDCLDSCGDQRPRDETGRGRQCRGDGGLNDFIFERWVVFGLVVAEEVVEAENLLLHQCLVVDGKCRQCCRRVSYRAWVRLFGGRDTLDRATRHSSARRDLRRPASNHRVGRVIRFVFGRVSRRRDLELVLPRRRSALLLDCVRDLVREQMLAARVRRIELARTEMNVLTDGVRLRADGLRGRLRFAAGVHADTRQVGAERAFELALDRRGQCRAARRRCRCDRMFCALGDAVVVPLGLAEQQARGHRMFGRC